MAAVNTSPCLDCPDRHPACWSHCERYKAAKEARDAARAALYRDKDARGLLVEGAIAGRRYADRAKRR